MGDDDFFSILRQWAAEPNRVRVTTRNFIDLAEQVSGQPLDELFDQWLRSTDKPVLDEALAEATRPADPPRPPYTATPDAR